MLSLSHTTGHAIRALACLASHKNPPVFSQELAEHADVPQAYLSKILKKLNDAGIIESKRGYKGGVWLARPPRHVSLLQISEALDGKESISSCLLGSDFCSDARNCPTHSFWKKNRALIRKELERTTLADVVTFYQRRGQMPALHR